jgi:hypothetical protein
MTSIGTSRLRARSVFRTLRAEQERPINGKRRDVRHCDISVSMGTWFSKEVL